MRDERRVLTRSAHLVVATPGRLRDHIMRNSIDLGNLRAVVLDEADEMLDLGFREDLEFILGEAPTERQTLLFSATVPKSSATLAKNYQRDAVRISTKSEHSQHADIEYRAMTVSERDADNAIINILRFYEAPNAIVFGNTRAMVNRLTTRLSNRGFSVVALSGELSQSERTHALQAMRDGRARVCVATDVAARGIDLPNLDLVVHAELPSNHETLLHRSGRTGRAGRKGVSALIVSPKNRRKAERILNGAKLRADWSEAPSADAVRARDQDRMLADPSWQEEIATADRAAIDTLMDRFSSEQIAAAYLRLFHAKHSAPEELSTVDTKPVPRAAFGPSIWFSVAGGRGKNAEPRRLLPMLCKAGNLTKDDIGAIRIQQDESFVEIKEASVPAFLAAIGPGMTVEDNAALKQLNGPPSGLNQPRPKPAHRPTPRDPAPVVAPAPPPAANPPKSTTPVDWNDAPAPRVKKPKPSGKPAKFKPRTRPAQPTSEAAEIQPLSRRKPDGGKPSRPDKPRTGPAGPPPPKGKRTSKKNKARSQAKAAAKTGGSAPQRRGKS